MPKILVIGSGGAGKTTFSKRLGEILGVEVVHLDAAYWRPGWVEPAEDDWADTVRTLIEREDWVLDGNYGGTLDLRLEACDAVVLLDLPPYVCVWRVVKRFARYRGRTRPDVGSGCPERLTLEFLLWIWNYRRATRPKVLAAVRERGFEEKLIRLCSSAEVERYLSDAKRAG